MNDIKLLTALLTCGSYKNDEVVKALCSVFSDDIYQALGAYTSICERLSLSRLTLSEYMLELAAEGGILEEYLRSDAKKEPEVNAALYENFSSDVKILGTVAAFTAEGLKEHLLKTFRNIPDRLPVYAAGDTSVDPESVLEYKKTYGSPLFRKFKAFTYENKELLPIPDFDRIRLSDFKNYDEQREAVVNNTKRLLDGKPHSNVLLYGDRGTGKSSTVKAAANEFENIRIIYVPKDSIPDIYSLYDRLRSIRLKFILFIDDLTADRGEKAYTVLKQALDGSLTAIPENCAVYATTNRRHIVRENADSPAETERHAADARDESLTLYDRFGLFVTFMLPDKKSYLEIVEKLADDAGADMPKEELFAAAERFALNKGSRSPRTAKQFICNICTVGTEGKLEKI